MIGNERHSRLIRMLGRAAFSLHLCFFRERGRDRVASKFRLEAASLVLHQPSASLRDDSAVEQQIKFGLIREHRIGPGANPRIPVQQCRTSGFKLVEST